jgi:hypothetical protein
MYTCARNLKGSDVARVSEEPGVESSEFQKAEISASVNLLFLGVAVFYGCR